MRDNETQVPTQVMLSPSPTGEARIFAVLKADRRQVSDRRMTNRGGRRETDAIEHGAINPSGLRPTRLERTFLEPVAVLCR
jgi:hypothetical protein